MSEEPKAPVAAGSTAGSASAGAQRPAELPLRLPIRAAIYIDPDGTVHFGSLFAELVPVARELGHMEDGGTGAAPAGEEPR